MHGGDAVLSTAPITEIDIAAAVGDLGAADHIRSIDFARRPAKRALHRLYAAMRAFCHFGHVIIPSSASFKKPKYGFYFSSHI